MPLRYKAPLIVSFELVDDEREPRIARLLGSNFGASSALGRVRVTDSLGTHHECIGGEKWEHVMLECTLDSTVRYGKVSLQTTLSLRRTFPRKA